MADTRARVDADMLAAQASMELAEQKVKRAETLHRELAELGGVVSGHLNEIDEMLPGDDSELNRELAGGQHQEPEATPVPSTYSH